MAGIRVVAAACAVLAAPPAAPQDSGGGPERFDAMAQAIVATLNGEAERLGARPRVTFRPASTGPEGVRVYCDALSFGLRNALHRRVEAWRETLRITMFDVAVADARAVEDPPPPPTTGFEVGVVFRDCDHCPEMVVVPAGRFEMGSPASESGRDGDEGPQHEVVIGAKFAVGVYEVTFDEWDACVSNGGCGGYRPADQGWGRGERPVINVSWDDAQAYASWLSRETGEDYRLLSEAEWEYVARAGTVTRYWWGDGFDANRAQCCCLWCGDKYGNTAPVGSFGANAFGLHDVHGNVWEWVEDCWHENYARAPRDGRAWLGGEGGDCSHRVRRGGSWNNVLSRNFRSANRSWDGTGRRRINQGFRLFRSVRTFTP